MRLIITILALTLTACATDPGWHWAKPGATEREFNMDQGYCRAQGLAGTGGNVTMSTLLIMNSCMEGRGWQKVANRPS
jgi:hypothetical protein